VAIHWVQGTAAHRIPSSAQVEIGDIWEEKCGDWGVFSRLRVSAVLGKETGSGRCGNSKHGSGRGIIPMRT